MKGIHLITGVAVLLTAIYHSSVTAQPTLVSFTLNMTPPEQLILTFNSSINVSSCNASALVLQNAPSKISSVTVTFQNASCQSTTNSTSTIEVMIDDWITVQGSIDIATSAINTYIAIQSGFIADVDGNANTEISSSDALQVSIFTENTNPPFITTATLDLNERMLIITLSEAINPSMFQIAGFQINYVDRLSQNTQNTTLMDGSISVVSPGILAIQFAEMDLLRVKSSPATNFSLTVAMESFTDGNGMANAQQTDLAFSTVLRDMLPPSLLSYSLNLDSGVLEFTFSEPIDVEAFNPGGITIVGGARQPFAFSSGTIITNTQNFNTILAATVSSTELNQIKLFANTGSVNIALNSSTVSDTSGNPVTPISTMAAIKPDLIIPDMTPPQLVRFIPGTPQEQQVTYIFDEFVSTSTWTGAGITYTLTDSSQTEFMHSGFSKGMLSPDFSDMIIYSFSADEFSLPFSEQYTDAYSSGSISLQVGNGLISDLSGNRLIAPSAPLIFSSGPDTDSPRLTSFSLDMNTGDIIMSFSEPVMVLSRAEQVTIQDRSVQPNSSYALQFNGTVSPKTPSAEITLTVDRQDLNAIKLNPNLATSLSDTFLVILGTFANDTSGNSLIEDLNGTQAAQFVPDTTPPVVLLFSIDLNSGTIQITFSEPISLILNYPEIFVASSLLNQPIGISISGSNVNAISNMDTSISIALSNPVFNMIKNDAIICTNLSSCHLVLTAGSVSDLFGNAVVSPLGTVASMYTADTTRPALTAYTIDLNNGQLELTFSEPMNIASFVSSGLIFLGTASNVSLDILIETLGSREMNTILSMTVSSNSLNGLKLLHALERIAIVVDSNSISDMAGNVIVSVSSSAPLLPVIVTPDTTPPSLVDFIAHPPEERQITLVFDEPVNASTWDGTKLTIVSNTRDRQETYNNFILGNVTPAFSVSITYSFSEDEFNSSFSERYSAAFYDGYLSLVAEGGLILDLNLNPLIEPPSPFFSNNGSEIPDLVRPMTVSFSLDLNTGVLEMTFSENVTSIVVQGQVRLQNGLAQTNAYTLTQNGTTVDRTSTTISNIVVLAIDSFDLNSIKHIDNLASSMLDTYLVLLEGFATDESGNTLMAQQNGLQVSAYTPDTARPVFLGFDLDMDSGSLSLSFNEPVSMAIQYDNIYTTGILQNTPGGINVTGSNASLLLTSVQITILNTALDEIKFDSDVCTSISDCLVFLTESSFSDTSGNQLLPPPTASLVTNFIADTTSPDLISYSIDFDTGQIELSFTEPMILATFDPFGITLLGSLELSEPITLDDALVLSSGSLDSTLNILIPSQSLNELKLLHRIDNILLALQPLTIRDKAGNMITEIVSTSGLPPLIVVEDTTRPSLIEFIPGTPDDMQITLLFDEYVNTSTWDGTRLTLTLTTLNEERTYSPFTDGILAPLLSDRIMYNFSQAEFNSSFTALYAEAYANYSVSLLAQAGLIRDISGNSLVALNTPLVFSQVDNIRPIFLNFTLDLNRGALLLTFSEAISVRSVSGHVRFQDASSQPSNVYTLTRNGTIVLQSEVVMIIMDGMDLNNIKLGGNLATSIDNTFLLLLEPFAVDTSGNDLEIQQNATRALTVIEDTSGPVVTQFDLDLDSSIMSLQFNEPVRISTFDHTKIVFSNTSGRGITNREGETIELVNVEVIAQLDAILTSFRILLGINDTVSVKSAPLCYSRDNCFGFFQSGLIADIYNNPTTATNISLQVSTLLEDVTPPRLVAFTQFDLDAGLFTLIFSEPVNSSSTDFTFVQFVNVVRNPTSNITLSEGFTTPDHIEIDFLMTREDLNMIKIRQMLCTERDNCWVRLPSFFINDVGMNPFLHSNYQPDAQASFHQPLSFIPDITPPILDCFSVDMNSGKVVLSFSEVVIDSSFSPNAVTLLGSPGDGTAVRLSGETTFERSSTGDEVIVQLTLADLNILKAQDLYTSENDSFVIISGGLLDSSSNIFQTIPPEQALQVSVYTRDSTQPVAITFDRFNREIGSLLISFNEPVIIDTVRLRFLQLLSFPNSTRFTLTGGEVVYSDDSKLSLAVTFSRQDRIQIKTITDLAINEETIFVSMLEGFVEDTSENVCQSINESHPLILAEGQFIEDTIRASLSSYTLDINTGAITLNFNDVINSSSVDVTLLSIQNSALTSSVSHSLSEESLVQSNNSNILIIVLSIGDLNVLKLNLNLATGSSNTYISFSSTLAVDIEGKPIISVENSNASPATNYLQDLTSPEFNSFNLDMNTGLLELVFSEPILVSSTNICLITFHNNESMMYTLTESAILTEPATSLTLLINITYDDLNQLKSIPNLAGNRSNTYINLIDDFVTDTNANKIQPSSQMVATFIEDTIQPHLLYFDAELSSLAVLTIQFSEAVAVHGNASSFFTIQNDASNPTIVLPLSQIDTISQPALDQVQITLRLSYTTRLLTDAAIGSSVDTLFLALVTGGVTDHNGNDAIEVLPTGAQRVRTFSRPCFDVNTFSDVLSGTCMLCPVECVDGCTGSLALAGSGGCNMCSLMLLSQNGTQVRCLPSAAACPRGYFSSSNFPQFQSLSQTVCEPCHELCATCTSSSTTNCQGCNSAFMTSQPYGPIVQCLSSCSVSTNPSLCGTCHSQCNGCTGTTSTDCVQCREDSMAVDGSNNVRCVPRCYENQFLSEDSPGEYTCQSCHRECINCTGPSDRECVRCRNVNNTLTNGGMCIDVCPEDSYKSTNRQCLQCHQQCVGCNGPTSANCTSCKEDVLTTANGVIECVRFCPFGMVFDTTVQECRFSQEATIAIAVCVVVAVLLIIVIVAVIVGLIHRHWKNKGKLQFERRRPSVVFMNATFDDPGSATTKPSSTNF